MNTAIRNFGEKARNFNLKNKEIENSERVCTIIGKELFNEVLLTLSCVPKVKKQKVVRICMINSRNKFHRN